MRAILLGGRGRCLGRWRGWSFGGGCVAVEPVIQAHPKDVILIELAGCVGQSCAIGKLIDPAQIDIFIFCPGEPMIAQRIFYARPAKHIFVRAECDQPAAK